MFKKMFGGGEAKKPAAPQIDAQETITKLNAQCENVQKRINVVENKMADMKREALEKRKKKDDRGALICLQKMKMYEKEVKKLDGQSIMLENQKMMIESTHFDKDVISGMKDGKDVMEQMNKQMDIDDIAELQDDLADQQAEIEQRQEFFANVADEGKEDLMAELDELEALAIEEDMEGEIVPNMPINVPGQVNPVPVQANEEEEK